MTVRGNAERALVAMFAILEALDADDRVTAQRVMSSRWTGHAFAARRASLTGLVEKMSPPSTFSDLGVLDQVDIFEGERFRFRVGRVGPYSAGVAMVVWPFDVILEDGEWRVEPDRTDQEPIGTMNLL